MNNIFISYRRKDAATEAYLLYKDLVNDGYSVFYDHKSLGEGNFRSKIRETIRDVDSFIVFLSAESFGSPIMNEDDMYRNEIKWALEYRKRIVGIILKDFTGFPDDLPEEINAIRNMNCLHLHIGYYEAMYSKLVSGNFLPPPLQLQEQAPSEVAIQKSIPNELQQLSTLSTNQRMQYTQLLLQIMNTFNNSPVCMRFYRYIDLYDRNNGSSELPEYDGDVPMDLATYLSFFETLYIIIGSETMELSVLDFAYRYRFFAGCNNPLMQQSELLPLGYQYPNIMSLYNIWCDYVVNRYDHSVKCDRISDEIPLYDNDLHKRYAAYSFAKRLTRSMKIRFLNRNLIWLNATIRLMDERDLDDSMAFQKNIVDGIENNDSKNLFEPLSIEEMRRSLKYDYCIGLYKEDRLIAQMNLILDPRDAENLTLDLPDHAKYANPLILDYVVVHQEARGFAIQKELLLIAEFIGKNNNKSGICAVTSPHNTHSIKNFLSQNYNIVDTRKKYHSIRHYMWKIL